VMSQHMVFVFGASKRSGVSRTLIDKSVILRNGVIG